MKTLEKVKLAEECWGEIAAKVDSVTESSQLAVTELEKNSKKVIKFQHSFDHYVAKLTAYTLEKYFSAFTSDDPEKVLALEKERLQAQSMI